MFDASPIRGPYDSSTMSRPVDLANVDLNLLYTFHAVAASGGVGAAARTLRRSQPAVTARIRQLERDLGVVLFERAGRGVKPTIVGRAVLERVAGLVASLGTILDEIHAAGGEPVGTVRVGALPTLTTYVLPPVVAELLAAYPRLRFDIAPGLLATHLERLARGELDAVVSVGDAPERGLAIREVGQVRAMAAVPASMFARARVLKLEAMRRHPFIG
jgi:DNA-binding transcriptional LysR family regulator